VSRRSYLAGLGGGLLIIVLTLACLILIAVFSPAKRHDREFVYVVVDRGLSYSQIAERFVEAGLVREERLFLILGRLFGIENRAKAGRYRFASTSNMVDILKTLYKGATYRERILVRPGKTMETVVEIMSSGAAVDSAGFAALIVDSAFVGRLGVPSSTAEGYLYPDTYDVEWKESPESVIRRMVANFFRAFDETLRTRARQMNMTVNEVVTLASIIEKEAMLDSERPLISAVFHNRLKIGMKLQADPTVRYALKKWTGRVLYRDLEFESPFNTYWARGLPPRPICSPSLASLVAALYPVPGSKDLYFVARGDGGHFFSHDARSHNRAKARWKEVLRQQAVERKAAEEAAGDSLKAEVGDGSDSRPAGQSEDGSAQLKDEPAGGERERENAAPTDS
jgi:UPF0755 protein